MKRYLYFNQHLKDPRSKKPKAVIQADGRIRYAYAIEIVHEGVVVARVRAGRLKAPRHTVRAWVETTCEVRAV